MDSSLNNRFTRKKAASVGSMAASKTFFMVGLGLWLFCKILDTSTFADSVHQALRVGEYCGFYLCLFSELFSREFTLRSLSLFAVLAFLAVILSRVHGADLLITLVIAFASRHYDFRLLLKFSMSITIISVLLVVTCSFVGLIPQVSDTARNRVSLGFGWVTYLSHYYLELVMCYTLLKGYKVRWLELAISLFIDFLIYSATGSRNSFILVIVFVVAFACIKISNRWNCDKRFAFITALSYPLCAVASVFLYHGISLQSQLGASLNSLLSNRLVLTQRAIDLYGIRPFGNPITWTAASGSGSGEFDWSQYLYVDCSYINILITYGWVVCVLLIIAFSIVSYKATLKGGTLFGAVLIIFALHGIVDPQLMNLHYCALLLLFGNLFDPCCKWLRRMKGFPVVS